MSRYLNVVRFHLMDRINFVVLPPSILTFVFLIDLLILELTPGTGTRYVGGLGSIFILIIVMGVLSVARSLPFGLTLGISRRSYYFGTVLLSLMMAAAGAIVITIGQAVERATDGWGIGMGFFRVPHVLDGAWYLTLLSVFVTLALCFVYGMWFGLVYRRWALIGAMAFLAAQITVLALAALLTTWVHGWHDVAHFFATLSAVSLTGLLAVIAVLLLVGGLRSMRRVTV